ncbi:MAG: aromatic ring-hydroxylating dioxygenase subunit alpha [Burkholderiales bacterium]|nr:aromatic ring-hydroxylating dioxygenase subunit alpha [Burkholderiales bacterium]
MADLPKSIAALAASRPQLPVAWYVDPEVYAAEQKALFQDAPGYVGHEAMVPEVGNYHTLAWMGHGKLLARGAGGVSLLSNVCRHRQALMLEGRGAAHNFVCPLHRWTYDLGGKLIGAPHFDERPCRDLERWPLQSWHGLLFAGKRDVAADLAGFSLAREFDSSGFVYHGTTVDELPFNWKTFLEIYLELYHVEAVHPGLSKFVDPGNYSWEFGERWSNQVLGVYEDLKRPGTPAYARYQQLLLEFRNGEPPRYGTLWFILYPNVMLEWYPESLVVSTLVPRSATHTTNVVDFFYPEEIHHFEPQIVEAHQKAYAETAAEDAVACERMDRGRRALHARGADDRGPYQSPTEDGMIHFHEFVRRHLHHLRDA